MEPVIIVSPEDLAALVKNAVEKALEARDRREEEESAQVFGLQGIADLFGCSTVTALKYKQTFLAPRGEAKRAKDYHRRKTCEALVRPTRR